MPIPEQGVTSAPDPFAVRPRPNPWREQTPVVAAVALGGALGATARYAATLAWPTHGEAFPWSTLTVNITGCALMGVIMVLITDIRTGHQLLRPFLGTGVLGGYTTFSSYAADIDQLIDSGHTVTASAYLVATPVLALTATWTTAACTRRLLLRRTP
ncbi:fluoride efflux transporter CrcB [Nocardia sp. 004]|uniref:fluoride efflux transporter CrcB n=1 Tax=Nocardia sp. 004 TaxID=3385978 RepID=UPI00399EEEE7